MAGKVLSKEEQTQREAAKGLLDELNNPATPIERVREIVVAYLIANPGPFVHVVKVLLRGEANPIDQSDRI